MSLRTRSFSSFEAHDRIFLLLIGAQGLLLAIFAFGLSVYLAKTFSRNEEVEVQEVFHSLETELTESVYQRQLISDSNPNAGNPALQRMQESLSSRGIHARVAFVRCEGFRLHPEREKLFELEIGGNKLNFCVLVERSSSIVGRVMLYGFGAVALVLLLELFLWYFIRNQLERRILKPLVSELEQRRIEVALGKQAHKVAHDIRSPLAALQSLSEEIVGTDDHQRLLLTAIGRIKNIASSLLNTGPSTEGVAHEITLVGAALRTILDEKRHRTSLKQFRFAAPDGIYTESLFAAIGATDFERILSNLVENAIESAPKNGLVRIEVVAKKQEIELSIIDDGKGVPSEILAKLGKEPVTHGKEHGNGIGFYESRKMLLERGGDLLISSELGKGSTVKLRIPRVEISVVVARELDLTAADAIVIVDDDRSQHEILLQKLKAQKINIEMRGFSDTAPLAEWRRRISGKVVFIVDYDLGPGKAPGLEWIETASRHDRCYLHTSHYQDKKILERCGQAGAQLIPKGYLHDLPTQAGLAEPTSDAVLIDDDSLVREIWERAAKKNGVTLFAYPGIEAFRREFRTLPKSCAIYCDENLGEGERGSEFLKQLRREGFDRLYLVTGVDAQRFSGAAEFQVSKNGKSPPW